MPTTIDSAGITFNDATSLTSAVIPANAVGATQIANGSVTAEKLGTNEQKQIAKAWVNFNGTTSPGTIRSSYNVSSVTKNGTGNYTVNFVTPMTDLNYSAVASGGLTADTTAFTTASPANFSLGSVDFRLNKTGTAATLNDSQNVLIQVFGN